MQLSVEHDMARRSDGTPNYPYITGFLIGTVTNAVERLNLHPETDPSTSREQIKVYLQENLDLAIVWAEHFSEEEE